MPSPILPPAAKCFSNTPPGCPLSNRELEVLTALAEGLTYKQTARKLDVAFSTVRTLVSRACQRLGQPTSAQAVIACFKAGWIEVKTPGDPNSGVRVADCDRLTRVLDEMVSTVKEHKRDPTAVQRAYLEAFDRLLAARRDPDRLAGRQAMEDALGPLLDNAGVSTGKVRQRRDLLDLLVEPIAA